jgi:lytic murein transglycosylase
VFGKLKTGSSVIGSVLGVVAALVAALVANVVLACASPGVAHAQAASAPVGDPVTDPVTAPLESCIAALRLELPQHPEVRPESFDRITQGVSDLRPTIDAATQSQPEFKLQIWDYLARLVDSRRIAEGRAVLATQSVALQSIAARRGVDPATVVAVFGVETDYGKVSGKYPVVDATLSRACLGLDSKERKRHFFAALWLLQEGLVDPDSFRGSWAGAFGQTQFMPGTFVTYRDGSTSADKVDIVGNPADALATTANFIAGSGWVRGVRWGVEVKGHKAAAHDSAAAERDHGCLANSDADAKCKTVAQWAALGVTPIDAALALTADTRAALLAPAGEDGPAWLVTSSFQAIWVYNRADAYALAIGLLSDALRNDPPMHGAWPTDDIGLARDDMRVLQALLLQRGHGDVTPDGFDGPKTREAIRGEEARLGWPPSGRAGTKILKALKDAPPEPVAVPATEPASAPG